MVKDRNLEGPIIETEEDTHALVFFLHGWGSDGNDLIQIGQMWKSQLPKVTLLSPNGPEVCAGNPHGRQWFDILNNKEAQTLSELHQAYLDLKKYIKINLDKYKVQKNQYFLVGFSQGTMLALYLALREKLLGVVGYSGALLGIIPEDTLTKNEFLLVHGKNDNVVPIEKMYEAVKKLEHSSSFLSSKVFDNLEHSINEEGLQAGLNFIKSRINDNK
ncbi:MAG: phospholipase [Rickettsiales bacterium]|nr:phospholipase [Rickettsiales bacterium]OUV81289.1 MAG: hypothetical protein CBC91_02405 [Rickettsiales bacterium TMED131]